MADDWHECIVRPDVANRLIDRFHEVLLETDDATIPDTLGALALLLYCVTGVGVVAESQGRNVPKEALWLLGEIGKLMEARYGRLN